jgi:flagellar M-ring protein FliF
VTETESISQRTFDPDSRVAISTDVQESSGKSEDSRGGDVTVASNLPDGDAGGANGASQNENSETRSLTNYEVSQTQRDVLRSAGAVRRLTVAVLVNDVTETQADGTVTVTPRTPEELADLEELVASAVGFDEERGDQITLRSMSFEPIPTLGTEVADQAASAPLNIMQLIQVGVLAVVALILGLFVVRPILSPSKQAALPPLPRPQDGPQTLISAPDQSPGNPEILSPNQQTAAIGTEQSEDPVDRLRKMITEREDETIQILQNWMEDPAAKEQA